MYTYNILWFLLSEYDKTHVPNDSGTVIYFYCGQKINQTIQIFVRSKPRYVYLYYISYYVCVCIPTFNVCSYMSIANSLPMSHVEDNRCLGDLLTTKMRTILIFHLE